MISAQAKQKKLFNVELNNKMTDYHVLIYDGTINNTFKHCLPNFKVIGFFYFECKRGNKTFQFSQNFEVGLLR